MTAVAAAFVPLVWVIALLAAVVAAALLRAGRRLLINIAIAVVVPPVLLIPWTFQLAAHPSDLLLEAGVQQPGLASPHLATKSLMLLSPGGPGLPPVLGERRADHRRAGGAAGVAAAAPAGPVGLDRGRARPARGDPGQPAVGPARGRRPGRHGLARSGPGDHRGGPAAGRRGRQRRAAERGCPAAARAPAGWPAAGAWPSRRWPSLPARPRSPPARSGSAMASTDRSGRPAARSCPRWSRTTRSAAPRSARSS